MADIKLAPCPFCGSTKVDPNGWASTERKGPACDDCGGTADTVELSEIEVSSKHLHRYVSEMTWRYNRREIGEGARFNALISGADGRLTYKGLIA